MRDGSGWEEVRDWIAELKVPRANSELISDKLAANSIWNRICLLCYGVCFRSDEGFFSRVPGFNAAFCRSCSRGSIHND